MLYIYIYIYRERERERVPYDKYSVDVYLCSRIRYKKEVLLTSSLTLKRPLEDFVLEKLYDAVT